ARRIAALLAHHGDEAHVTLAVADRLLVALDAQPHHLAAALHHLGADARNVVLGVAGDDAGAATVATVEIDRHRPTMLSVGVAALVHRHVLRTARVEFGLIGAHGVRGLLVALGHDERR